MTLCSDQPWGFTTCSTETGKKSPGPQSRDVAIKGKPTKIESDHSRCSPTFVQGRHPLVLFEQYSKYSFEDHYFITYFVEICSHAKSLMC